jgi:acetaldehyde dehydrogenase (acetylating)
MRSKKLNIAFLGSGMIAIDLLIKAMRLENLNCLLVAGRNYHSKGMKIAKKIGVSTSDCGIDAIMEQQSTIDLVFDATSAIAHIKHWDILKNTNIKVVDMTPSRIGCEVVPTVNLHDVYKCNNINMISCGGQVSIPLVHAVSEVVDNIEYIEVVSSLSSESAGPATRSNLDEYIYATEKALLSFSSAKKSKVILILNPADPPVNMQTTISFLVNSPDMIRISASVISMVDKLKQYVPGYELLVGPVQVDNGRVVIIVKTIGLGDYLPSYAGNLDIINSAAIAVACKLSLVNSK